MERSGQRICTLSLQLTGIMNDEEIFYFEATVHLVEMVVWSPDVVISSSTFAVAKKSSVQHRDAHQQCIQREDDVHSFLESRPAEVLLLGF